MPINGLFPLQGGCACKAIRYEVETPPLFIHCCHCTGLSVREDCQGETGSAFALNLLIESDRVKTLTGIENQRVTVPSQRVPGQEIVRCSQCSIALWSFYPDHGPFLSFVRVGTLDRPHSVTPDIHLFLRSKVPWLSIPDAVPAMKELYKIENFWPEQSIMRRRLMLPKVAAYYREKEDERRLEGHSQEICLDEHPTRPLAVDEIDKEK